MGRVTASTLGGRRESISIDIVSLNTIEVSVNDFFPDRNWDFSIIFKLSPLFFFCGIFFLLPLLTVYSAGIS